MMPRRRTTPQEEKDARRLQEFFTGRLNLQEALVLIHEHDGNFLAAADFVWKAEPARVRQLLNKDEEVIRSLQRETRIVGAKFNGQWKPDFQVRQFACGTCDSMWWRKVPSRKKVSKCTKCMVHYDAVPRSEEYGVAEFLCQECGSVFRGFGWMEKTVSPCYRCHPVGGRLYVPGEPPPQPWGPSRGGRGRGRGRGSQAVAARGRGAPQPAAVAVPVPVPPPQFQADALPPGMCMPVRVLPPSEVGQRRFRRVQDMHSCNAPNCFNRLNGVPPHARALCVHPRVRPRQAIFPSRTHRSTGSTVDTWMTQTDLRAAMSEAASTLPDIDERDDDDSDDDDDDDLNDESDDNDDDEEEENDNGSDDH